jgi:hypothetical protein
MLFIAAKKDVKPPLMPKSKRRSKRNTQTPKIVSINASVKVSHRYRYAVDLASTPNTYNITRANLLNLLFINNSGAKNNARLIAGIKLKRVEIISMSSSAVIRASSPISLEWLSNYGPSSEITDTPSSVSMPACIKTSPPKNSLASFWSLTGSNESEVLFKIVLPSSMGHTIDVWVEQVLMDDESPVQIVTQTSGVVNQLYEGYLDGQNANSVLQPVSYTNLF